MSWIPAFLAWDEEERRDRGEEFDAFGDPIDYDNYRLPERRAQYEPADKPMGVVGWVLTVLLAVGMFVAFLAVTGNL